MDATPLTLIGAQLRVRMSDVKWVRERKKENQKLQQSLGKLSFDVELQFSQVSH